MLDEWRGTRGYIMYTKQWNKVRLVPLFHYFILFSFLFPLLFFPFPHCSLLPVFPVGVMARTYIYPLGDDSQHIKPSVTVTQSWPLNKDITECDYTYDLVSSAWLPWPSWRPPCSCGWSAGRPDSDSTWSGQSSLQIMEAKWASVCLN